MNKFEGSACPKGHTERYVSNGDCVVCAKARTSARQARLKDNPGFLTQRAASSRAWYEKNKFKVAAAAKAWKKANRGKHQESSRKGGRKAAGLPEPTRACPERCENCGRLPGKIALHLDHDHVTGKFRGWLCNSCNLGMGLLGDTVAAIQQALRYLRRPQV